MDQMYNNRTHSKMKISFISSSILFLMQSFNKIARKQHKFSQMNKDLKSLVYFASYTQFNIN